MYPLQRCHKKQCSWKVIAKALTVKIPVYFGYHLRNFCEMQRNPKYVCKWKIVWSWLCTEVNEFIDFSSVQ